MEVTSDKGMEEEICKYKQEAASARQRVLGWEGTGCFRGPSWGHPQLPLTVCRLQQTADKAKFERPGLPGQSDGKKCSPSPTGQKTKAPAHPQPRRGRDKQRLAPPGPWNFPSRLLAQCSLQPMLPWPPGAGGGAQSRRHGMWP